MGRSSRWKATVTAAQNQAALAVKIFNDPNEPRSFEGFVVHMHIAWLYLLQARFERDGIDDRIRQSKNSRRFVKVDGEIKRWDLSRAAAEHFEQGTPVRANLDFFIALRNKIEHRFPNAQRSLAIEFQGHCQALLSNFHAELVDQFGSRYSMADRLGLPIFVGTFSEEGQTTLRKLKSKTPASLRGFASKYESGLDEAIRESERFQLRVGIALELAPKSPDALAMEFRRFDDLSDEQLSLLQDRTSVGTVIVREKVRSIINSGYMRPSQAAESVSARIPFEFKVHHFTACWKHFEVRPSYENRTTAPERTIEDFCIYDSSHRDYAYTPAFVDKLVRSLQTPAAFEEITGLRPVFKEGPVGLSA